MRQVRDAQQELAQLALVRLVLGGEHPLVLAERAAARLQRLGLRRRRRLRRSAPTCFEKSLTSARSASRRATMSRWRSSSSATRSSCASSIRLAAAGERRRTSSGVVAQLSDVDHRVVTLPVGRHSALRADCSDA